MRAGSAGFARAERYIRLQDAASVVHDGQTLGRRQHHGVHAACRRHHRTGRTAWAVRVCRHQRRNSCSRWRPPTSTSRTSRTDARCDRSRSPSAPQCSSAPRAPAAPGDSLEAALIDMQLDADGSRTMTGLTAQEADETHGATGRGDAGARHFRRYADRQRANRSWPYGRDVHEERHVQGDPARPARARLPWTGRSRPKRWNCRRTAHSTRIDRATFIGEQSP